MSLINFLNPKLKPSVECDAICEDGYSAANLIADDVEQLARGFMGFSLIKPPVEIIFEFPKAIDLKVIKLWNTNNALRSTAFEVHGKYEGIWERVAYARDLDKNIDSLTFCYQSDYSRRQSAAADAQQSSEKVFFFRTAHKILANTTSLKIIIRATHKSPPVLRKAQVWGLPARSLDKADRELMRTIWNEITHPLDGCGSAHQQSQQNSPHRQVPELSEESRLKIPEEFLDGITWELMIFPTVLPSGKIVDQSTIDRHSEVEAKWGRMPSDPFTGLEFNLQRKAILNLALKARIEKFLLDNSEHFKTVPRCLGSTRVRRSRNRHASQFASAYNSTTFNTSSNKSIAYNKHNLKKSAATSTLGYSSSLHTTPLTKRLKLTHKSPATTETQTSATATTSSSALFNRAAAVSTAGCIEGDSVIDTVIQQALQKMTRYTVPPAETTIACCIRCKTEQFSYEIRTCRHLLCRECINIIRLEEMCICKTSFQSADVERIHMI